MKQSHGSSYGLAPSPFVVWANRHPCTSYLLLLFGVPLSIVATVFLCASAVMLPLCLVMGWM